MSRDSKDLIVGLDIGTSKIVALVAELTPEGRVNVIGMGQQESRGLKKGVVVNIEETVATISRVLQEVELMADCKVRDVYTGIAGSHIRSFNSNGMVAIKDREVTPMDVERVIETARAMPIPADQEILHILTQEFIIDDQDGIREPIGMSGFRLEVKVHIVTGAVSAAQNIIKCVRRCGLEVNDLVLQPLASSCAVLSEDEKDLGICLIDIGGGTTDLAVWTQGAIRHTSVIPIAGDQVTNDIAMACARRRARPKTSSVVRLCSGRPRRPGRYARRHRCRRPPFAQAFASRAGGCHPAACRGTLRTDPGRASPFGVRGRAVIRHRAHRRRLGDAGHDRARRGDFSHARPLWASQSTREHSPTSSRVRALRPLAACCSRRRRSASGA
jgi:Ethanolamine utilization protein EutJ (predicted chaperonin)